MSPAVATRPEPRPRSPRRGRTPAGESTYRSGDELREVVGRTLEAVNRSATSGAALRAAGLNIRIEVPDLGAVVAVRASEDPTKYIEWRFDRRGRPGPSLVLRMDSEVANAWLQGRESIPMAIARRRMRCSGNARDALRYLPVLKVISKSYRSVVRSDYPHLAI
jgi:hypothetical protein